MSAETRRGPGVGCPDLDKAHNTPLLDTEDSAEAVPVSELDVAEAEIRTGLLSASRALRTIREHRLYKLAGYHNFDNYCRDRLGMSRDRADQIIAAGEVIAELPTIVGSRVKESHVRALRAVADDPGMVEEILGEVMSENDGKLTAKLITSKIEERRCAEDRRVMITAMLGPGAGALAASGLLSDGHVQQLQRLAGFMGGATDPPLKMEHDAIESWMTDDSLAENFTLMTRPWDGYFYVALITRDTPHRAELIDAFRCWWKARSECTEPVGSLHRITLHFAACTLVKSWSVAELEVMVDWYEDILSSAMLVVGIRNEAGEPVIVEPRSRDWYGHCADLRHAGFGHLVKDPRGALVRWSQTREALLLEDDEAAGPTLAFPSCIIADQLMKAGR